MISGAPVARCLLAVTSVVALACVLTGCAGLSYYAQAVGGHARVVVGAQPIEEVLDHTTDQRIIRQLQTAVQLRRFAVDALGLPDNDSYTTYVDLKRRFVVWNVVAAQEFSLEPEVWCFSVVGCLAYRGYYDKDAAQALATELRAQGMDVTVGGVRAYSTLGWFDDPLLSSMLAPPDPYLASVMFHELAHQVVYIPDDSGFNEAFATAVERAGVRRWMVAHGTSAERQAYERSRQAQSTFAGLVADARAQLATLYARDVSDIRKRQLKAEELERLRERHQVAMLAIGNPGAYAGFFDENLNNARLVSVATYFSLVPAFEELLRQQNGDLTAFYHAARLLGARPKAERDRTLAQLTASATHKER